MNVTQFWVTFNRNALLEARSQFGKSWWSFGGRASARATGPIEQVQPNIVVVPRALEKAQANASVQFRRDHGGGVAPKCTRVLIIQNGISRLAEKPFDHGVLPCSRCFGKSYPVSFHALERLPVQDVNGK